ncbi:hypothetical protein HK105_200226 [Polyrhizophydium stewartii]|uniref:YMC020W-like alpha/beta hydrolase domain-containing protein n=1 Tax=Polyrhizophydium stewartii TaxID=2732419 RepID=A0ABR4NL07_9FUNG
MACPPAQGVHGWFPHESVSPWIHSLLGPPTGTSKRLVSFASAAVRKCLAASRHTKFECTIATIPLEWNGTVEERVAAHMDQISSAYSSTHSASTDELPSRANLEDFRPNVHASRTKSVDEKSALPWRKEAIEAADLVYFVGHSQGSIVTTILVASLVDQGILDPARQNVCILALAGISHGPFPGIASIVQYLQTPASAQLFELNKPESALSQCYSTSLATVLERGCRLVAVGSWMDEVVPLHSSLLCGYRHPHIHRVLFVEDAELTGGSFILHLAIWCIRLLNRGLSDHGLIYFLSPLAAGSLVGTVSRGHTILYEDLCTFRTGFEFLVKEVGCTETNKLIEVPLPSTTAVRPDPFGLTWAFARVVSDPAVRSDAAIWAYLIETLDRFDKWNPPAGPLRDAKAQLAHGIRRASFRK